MQSFLIFKDAGLGEIKEERRMEEKNVVRAHKDFHQSLLMHNYLELYQVLLSVQ